MTAADTRPGLTERLAEAQREERPLAAEVARLEHELDIALGESNYLAVEHERTADRAGQRAHRARVVMGLSADTIVSGCNAARVHFDRNVALRAVVQDLT